ncbi:MAG: PhzF family phenazine biosynthesis protein [Thiohalomonadales bacterium]
MELTLYQIDAFANKVFQGNPAAVCPLDNWLEDNIMQAIAQENNLSETAFFVSNDNGFDLRWFTPTMEINFCGHATLAAAYVLFECLSYPLSEIKFNTRVGEFIVSKEEKNFKMDFPLLELEPYTIDEDLINILGLVPQEAMIGTDIVILLASEHEVVDYSPNFELLKTLPGQGVCITAPGVNYDFVSRFFVPKAGINEDPVTGSTHCALAPYWCKKLNKKHLSARQLSTRGGNVLCQVNNSRVTLRGQAVKYMQGTIYI